MTKKHLYGLIGYPLGHSFSPQYFAEKFSRENIEDAAYLKFELSSVDLLPQLLKEHPQLRGFNVTIPYKQAVMPYLHHIDPKAAKIGAVNVVKVANDGRLAGFNSDYYGFRNSLEAQLTRLPEKALVLGTGGASRAVKAVLDDMGIATSFVSRTPKDNFLEAPVLAYEQLDTQIMQAHLLIVNTTPLGTYPNTEAAPPIPYTLASAQHFFYDLVYNPPVTRFMQLGQAQGAGATNGKAMLELQADKSWEIWTNEHVF